MTRLINIVRLRCSATDWLVTLAVVIWSYVVFSFARNDFSYDYNSYIFYFDRLANLTWSDLSNSMVASFPYPYVFVPPTDLFETGFALVARLLLSLGIERHAAYALIGALSIGVRLISLRALGLGWGWTVLLGLYSVTLFEANAIRLGVALTLTLIGFLALVRGRRFIAVCFTLIAALFHIQTLLFSSVLLAAYSLFPLMARSRSYRAAVTLVLLAGASSVPGVVGQLGLVKLADYADRTSGATGLNIVSISAVAALVPALWLFIRLPVGVRGDPLAARLWSSVLLATVPACVLLVLATNIGAFGDRVWQFALCGFVAVLPLMQTAFSKAKNVSRSVILLTLLCLAASVVNVTIRYPLSNFFSPLLPYKPITPIY